jgi:hypothetical protein
MQTEKERGRTKTIKIYQPHGAIIIKKVREKNDGWARINFNFLSLLMVLK